MTLLFCISFSGFLLALMATEGEEKESSSDWSDSDEDDEEGDDDPLRPSTHSALQAQWEWRTMADSLPDKYVDNLPPFLYH